MTGLRKEMAARYREFVARHADIYGDTDPGRYLRRADALDRGEPVEFYGWELPSGSVPRGASSTRYRLLPDGTLEELAALR